MLEKTYEPAEIEARIHARWTKADAFKAGRPERASAEPYSIVIPPPNVTGSLHMGHALNNTLQDVLCRFERMRGKDVLWQPGTDHAGIATQMVVERQLMERQEPARHQLGRPKFIERVWTWKAESGGTIVNQLKRLGASCDWSRERFTMDEGLSRAVLKVFVELYSEGLIYRDKRLVNWDPEFQSALSDLEKDDIEHSGSFKWARGQKDKDGNPVPFDAAALAKVLDRDPNGHMYYFRYPLSGVAYDPEDPSTFLTVGTTRPETMLGDTAVAVHPEDARYKDLIGKTVKLPLVGREIPIIADEYADPEKGSGAVKITPAHDFNDYKVFKRHPEIGLINILDAEAQLNENVPEVYRGLDRFMARKRVVADFEAAGLLEKIEPTTHAVPHAQRGSAVIEPWLTDQWYVDAAELAKRAIAVVESGETRFIPQNWEKTYFEWMRNIEPWCISRQIWWGHQIPAWYGPDGKVFVALDEAEAAKLARAHYKKEVALERDPDVLDTWFSSALWPFSTLGWPDHTPELKRYYPTVALVTGFDIIFFWVARMMMMGMYFMQEVPFRDVYIHRLVRDEKGAKMSKSKGNVVDPLGIIDDYGADALRFTLARAAAQGHDIKLAPQYVENNRNFATKLWNAARFAEVNGCARVAGFDPKSAREALNRWIAHETARATRDVTEAIEEYRFNDAANGLYRFVWNVFCDWYVELAKPFLTGPDGPAKDETRAMAAWALDQIFKLLHPFMPFVTEELWRVTGETGPKRDGLLVLTAWPDLEGLEDGEAEAEIGWVVDLITAIRSVRAEMNIPPATLIPLALITDDDELESRTMVWGDFIKRLARLSEVDFPGAVPAQAIQLVVRGQVAALPLAGVIDLAAERARLEKEMSKIDADIRRIDAKLGNPDFIARAPDEVVEGEREKREEAEGRRAKLVDAVGRLEGVT